MNFKYDCKLYFKIKRVCITDGSKWMSDILMQQEAEI
jgi:hypothetical protein